MAKDLYDILGITKSATDEDIRKAYKKLAITLHPDRFATAGESEKKEAEKKFKEINAAYEILSDKQKRSNYDQYGHPDGPQGFAGGGAGGAGGAGGGFESTFGGFEDILSSIFGAGGSARRNPNSPRPGDDIHVKVNLTFEEAYNGVTKPIKLNRDEPCPTCKGSGAKDPSAIKICTYCNGSGTVRKTQQNPFFGQQVVQVTCSACGGKGKTITEKCPTCRGNCNVRKEVSVDIPVPAGIENGVSMRLPNKGHNGQNGGGRGNLVIAVGIIPSERFKRVGNDLYMDLPIGYYDAACGSEIVIDTLKGDVKCKIPESTQSGAKIRLKGYGMKVLRKDLYGDLYVVVNVETPKGLSSKQLKLLKAFEDSLSDSQYPQLKKYKKAKK